MTKKTPPLNVERPITFEMQVFSNNKTTYESMSYDTISQLQTRNNSHIKVLRQVIEESGRMKLASYITTRPRIYRLVTSHKTISNKVNCVKLTQSRV